MNFAPFGRQVFNRFKELSKHELFVVGTDNRLLEAHYLASFAPGTDPMHSTRTEHDCSCCKNFIRNLGNVVAIVNGKIETVWDIPGVEDPYRVVAEKMDEFVRSQPITDVFRTKESKFGAEYTLQKIGTRAHTWNHFYGVVAAKHKTDTPDKVCGEHRQGVDRLKRGLTELSADAIESVRDLISSNAIYRGSEHAESVNAFQRQQKKFDALGPQEKDLFLWENAASPTGFFRSSVIGTLVQDISEGVDIEKAVRSFESKVAPANYMRPTAVITPKMVKDAMKTITEAGLEPALERRFAKISDITVNNVLWVDNSVRGKMKGGLEDLLMSAAVSSVAVPTKAEDISIDDFMANILPKAKGMEMLFEGRHIGNLVSLTAPKNPDTGNLFRWKNDFAWSYNGNIADSEIRRAVQGRGGRVDGAFRFSHSWNHAKRNASLMDLHVFMPGSGVKEDAPGTFNDNYGTYNKRVGWNHRKEPNSGGVQDVDYTDAAPVGYVPVENITFPDLKKMPEGDYICKIHNWNLRQPTEGGFKAEIEFAGQIFQYDYPKPLKHKEWVTVATVTLKDGVFTIKHHINSSATSQEKWSLNTETFVKVETVTLSPNYWDDNAVGNKHWFFMLDGCKNPDAARGFYNEFLNSNLSQHRKVFEVVADKVKCPPADAQLSGLGFSSTKEDSVTVKVALDRSQKMYRVKF